MTVQGAAVPPLPPVAVGGVAVGTEPVGSLTEVVEVDLVVLAVDYIHCQLRMSEKNLAFSARTVVVGYKYKI